MGKGKSSKGTKYVSKGDHSNVSSSTRRLMRNSRSAGERLIAQQEAFRKGKRVMVTIPNPNPHQTNKRFIRVPGEVAFMPNPDSKLSNEEHLRRRNEYLKTITG